MYQTGGINVTHNSCRRATWVGCWVRWKRWDRNGRYRNNIIGASNNHQSFLVPSQHHFSSLHDLFLSLCSFPRRLTKCPEMSDCDEDGIMLVVYLFYRSLQFILAYHCLALSRASIIVDSQSQVSHCLCTRIISPYTYFLYFLLFRFLILKLIPSLINVESLIQPQSIDFVFLLTHRVENRSFSLILRLTRIVFNPCRVARPLSTQRFRNSLNSSRWISLVFNATHITSLMHF